jgi:hypothetical protein
MPRAHFNHLVHHKLANSLYWTPQRMLRSAQLNRTIRDQLQETEFGESINPTLDALLLFDAVLLLASIPLDLLIAPSALSVSFLIALVPFAKTRYVHPHRHANSGVVLGRSLQPLRHDHPRLPSGAGAVALKRGEFSQQPLKHRIAKPQGFLTDCFREPRNDCQPGSGTFARSPPRFHCLYGQDTL